MFDGFIVTSSLSNTKVSFIPFLDIVIIFRDSHGFLIVDRIDSGNKEENIGDVELPVIALCETSHFSWLKALLPFHRLMVIQQIQFKQVPMFNALIGFSRLGELFDTNPILVWLLVCYLDTVCSVHCLGYFSLCKRKDILTKILNFECGMKHVKFIKKIEIEFGSDAEASLILRSVSNIKIVESFKHRSSIKSSELFLIDKYPFLINSRLLPALARRKCRHFSELIVGIGDLLSVYRDTIDLGQSLGFKDSASLVAICESSDQIYRLHAKWIELLNESQSYLEEDIIFEPFVKENCSQFEYVESFNRLVHEGRVMKHCVATYRERVIRKESYIFKVNFPERATLEVGFAGGEFFLKQLKLIKNMEPSKETYTEVNEWLRKLNKLLKDSNEETGKH